MYNNDYKSLGVVGTYDGLTQEQRNWINYFLLNTLVRVLHHGDEIGACDEAAKLFASTGTYIIAHPGNALTVKANCNANDLVLPWKESQVRIRHIVNMSEMLLAFPETEIDAVRSTTWTTVRYAKRQSVPFRVITPLGKVIE